MAKSLLFVCSLNGGRSVASEYLFRVMLQQRDERLAHQVKVASAGLITKEDVEWMQGFGVPIHNPAFGRPPYRSLIPVMLKRGIDLSAYRSKGLKRPMVEEADLIVVFDEYPPFRKAAILSFWPQAKEKVFTFREFVEAEVKGECLVTEDPYTAPYADEVFIDFPAEFLEANIAEIEAYLAQKMAKFLRYLQQS